MLHGYFDESGTHGESIVTSIGGCIGPDENWTAAEAEWSKILAEFSYLGVTHFHLSHCLMNIGEFELCDTPKRNYLITQLSQIIGRHNFTAINSGVVQDDWDDVKDSGPFFDAFPTPIALCFEDLVRSLSIWTAKNAPGKKVAPTFAYRTEWATGGGLGAPILQIYGTQPWYRSSLAAISFAHPKDCVPLQMADIVAGLVRIDVERRSGASVIGPTQALMWATGGRFVHGHWFDRESLLRVINNFNQTGEIYEMTA